MQEPALFVEHVLLSRLNSKAEPIGFRGHGAIEVVAERARGQIGQIEIQGDGSVRVWRAHEKSSHAVCRLAARRI